MSNYCPNCGTQLKGTEKFCENCGTPIVVVPESITEQTPIIEHSPAPTPSSVPKSRYAWCLAVIPFVLSWFLEDKLGSDYSILAGIIIPFVVNIIFVSADRRELMASGFNSSGWAWTGFFLQPVIYACGKSKWKIWMCYRVYFSFCDLYWSFVGYRRFLSNRLRHYPFTII